MCFKVCYILAGIPYSGLTVLKNCFEICGIPYANHFDVVGHNDINRLLLQDLNYPLESHGPLPQGWLDTKAAQKACDRIENLISQQKTSFVIADWMFCKTLPVWLQVLQKYIIEPKIVQIIRHPYEVAMSLQKYENIETRKGLLFWFSNIYTTLQYKQNQTIITLDQLIADPVTTLDKVLDGNVIKPYISHSNLLNFAQPSLKNHHASSFLDRDKRYFKPFAHIYDQLRDGQKNIETKSGIIDTLLYALSQNQTTTCQFLNKITQITSDTLTTLQAKVFLPSLKGETGIANTISLIKDQWQKIELSITEPNFLKNEKVSINLLNTKGSVLISSVTVLNQASQETVWQANTVNELEIIESSEDMIRLNHGETLGFIVAGENSKIYLPVLHTVSDIPVILQLWIKPSLEQAPLMKSWHKEVMSTSKNQTEHNVPNGISKFNSKFQYFFHVHYQKSNRCLLTQLCDLHGTDKGSFRTAGHPYKWKPHSYSDFYAMMFYPIRLNVRCLFECGIGTNNPEIEANMTVNGIPGASLRVWRDFFPNAQIIGADIDREVLFTEERITTYYIDQTDSESVIAFWKATDIKTVDIIIDDGLHISQAGICLFENSIDYLSEYGIYIIEDVKEQYLFDYKEYFDNLDKYFVFFINMFRPYAGLGDNNIIMIQKNSHLAANH